MSPKPAWVLWTPWPGEDAAALGPLAQHWVFWVQAPAEWGSSCFGSPCQPVALIAFSSLKILPQSSVFWQISCSGGFPSDPHQTVLNTSPLSAPQSPQSRNMLIFFFFKWGISNFRLPGSSLFLFLFFTGAAEWEGARHIYAAHLASGSVALNPLPSSVPVPHQAVPPLRRQD